LGNQVEAEEALRRAAELPQDPFWLDPVNEEVTLLRAGKNAQLQRALHLSHLGQEGAALALLEQTVQNYPEAADAWLQLGKTLLKQNNPQAAEQALRRASGLAPGAYENVYYLGAALIVLEDMS